MSWKDMTLGEIITLKRGYDLPNRLRKEMSLLYLLQELQIIITNMPNQARV